MNTKDDNLQLVRSIIEQLNKREALIQELKSLDAEKDLIKIIKLKYEQ